MRRGMYGGYRRSYGARKGYSRPKLPRVAVRKNVAVARASSVMRNRLSIQALKMSQYGSVQKSMVVPTDILIPTSVSPILFAIDDFTREQIAPLPVTHGGAFYTLTSTGALAGVGHWQHPPLLHNGNPFTEGFQQDIVNSGKYLALSNYVTLEIEGRPNLSNTRVRVQVFQQNMMAVYNSYSATTDFALPDSLPWLKHQAEFASGCFMPRKSFKMLFDKTVVINSSSVAETGQHGTTLNKKYLTIPWRPKGGKLVRQKISAPDGNSGNTVHTEPADGYFGPTQRNPGEIVWCLISTDDTVAGSAPGTVHISMKSLRTWRDPSGSY